MKNKVLDEIDEIMKCANCGGRCPKAKSKFQGIPIDAYKCEKCGEEYFDPEQAQEILLFNKLQKKHFKLKLGRIRSNLILRIPTAVEETLDLEQGETVDLRIKGKKNIEVLISD